MWEPEPRISEGRCHAGRVNEPRPSIEGTESEEEPAPGPPGRLGPHHRVLG